MPTDRAKLTAYLDETTYDTWHAVADVHGVTVSALIEAVGRDLDPTTRAPLWLRRAVIEARAVMAERRDRRPID